MKSPSITRSRALRTGLNGVVLVAALLSLAIAPSASVQNRYSLKIHNTSKFTVTRLYVQNAELGNWGPDEMKNFVLAPGKTFTLNSVKPGEYNIKFVDAKGRDCVLTNYAIIKDHSWNLTTEFLQKCRSWT
jgi:hypothetical protein